MQRWLFIFTFSSLAGWSQPAQQQAQPPIAVQVQMPPTNPWMHIFELVVPGIIGAGLALIGVWLTNRNNAATNAANRQHALEVERSKDEIAAQAKSRDNRWEFRKDIYVKLINSVTDIVSIASKLQHLANSVPSLNAPPTPEFLSQLKDNTVVLSSAAMQFARYAGLAPLAKADSISRVLQAQVGELTALLRQPLTDPNRLQDFISTFNALKADIQTAGRKELWETPEPELKAQAAKPGQ